MAEYVEDAGPVEAAGKWRLPVGDGVVTLLQIDFAFTLVIEAWLQIRIETAFSYGTAGSERRFDPEDTRSLAPLLDRHQARVVAAEIGNGGRLSLVFQDEMVLTVEPDDRYEAFNVVGQPPSSTHKFLFVALPGGGLARW